MSLALALDLPNQLANASLGLVDSVEARYARSLLATDPSGLSTGDLDSYYYNLGASIRAAVASPSVYSHEELARAVVAVKGLWSYSLGTDFDASSLAWGQAVAPFFSDPVNVVVEVESFIASFDATAGNTGASTGSWTTVNPDTDVFFNGEITGVGWAEPGEWLEYALPPALVPGTYTVSLRHARAATSTGTLTCGSSTLDVSLPPTPGWSSYAESVAGTLVVPPGATTFRFTYGANAFNLDYFRFIN